MMAAKDSYFIALRNTAFSMLGTKVRKELKQDLWHDLTKTTQVIDSMATNTDGTTLTPDAWDHSVSDLGFAIVEHLHIQRNILEIGPKSKDKIHLCFLPT